MREFYIGAFRSRAQCMRFFESLKFAGYDVAVVNTPREASIGCGISVQVRQEDFSRVRRLMYVQDYPSFAGWFLVRTEGRRYSLERL